MPKNRAGRPIDPTDHNRADGFSPGNMIVTKVPGLDSHAAFGRTGAVPITDMARTFDRRQPVVVINARTRKRQLIWAEIDSNPSDPADVTLIIRPGRNFDEGERYIVALRDLKKADGTTIAPREEFRAYRDALATTDPDIERRRAHYEELFRTLAGAGIARRRPVPDLGLHGGQPPEPDRPCAVDPRRRVREARRYRTWPTARSRAPRPRSCRTPTSTTT